MDWPGFLQLMVAFIAGAWVYSAGGRHAGIMPGGPIVKAMADRIASKIGNNGEAVRMPALPRTTS